MATVIGRSSETTASGHAVSRNGAWVQISELKYFNFDFNLEEGRNIKI